LRFTSVSSAFGYSIGGTFAAPGLTSANHFSTAARVVAGSMSPAITRLAFDGW
jgi:hypothetical protein